MNRIVNRTILTTMVVAAAGAGYIAKHWQNPSISRENLPHSPSLGSKSLKSKHSPLIRHRREKSCPLRCLARINGLGGEVSEEVTSSCDVDGGTPVTMDNYEDSNVLSVSSLSPDLMENKDLQGDLEETRASGDAYENSIGEMNTCYVSARKRSFLKSRRTNMQLIKPLRSLESCLMAQLYKDHTEMEEYVLRSVPSPSAPTVRPFLVTDGRKIISREKSDSFKVQIGTDENKLQKRNFSAGSEAVFGVPPLPKVGPLELPRGMKIRSAKGKGRSGTLNRSHKTANGKHLHSQPGSSHGALLFCLGISLGIISSFLANKREVDKLNELLKQTDNLVQDLQEELEMKDSLNVKELAIEDSESQDTHENSYYTKASHTFAIEDSESQDKRENSYYTKASNTFSSEQKMDELRKRFDGKGSHNQKAENHSDSMSQIEAELEAELERLELNMKSSNLEQRLSDLEEHDPEFRSNRELRASMFGQQVAAKAYADQDGSGTSTPNSANYAVSPRELSLRLHELVQSRLEERVKELEIALQNSQKKVQFMESEHMNPWREFSSSEVGSSSIHGSPIAIEQSPFGQPMVINLSREVLDSYNEAYDDLLKRNDSEEDLRSRCSERNDQENSCLIDGNSHYMPHCMVINRRTFEEQVLSDAAAGSGDEKESGDDEIEKLLIKHIVERTKKGSPAVLNAQRVLFSLDEKEN